MMSQHIQLHLLRLYTNEGYALFAGNPSKGFHRQSLDVVSELVSTSYLRAQGRLDNVLGTRRLPWSLCLHWDGSQHGPTVAFGTFVEIPNDQGTLHGIFFVHAVKLKGTNSLVPVVEGVIRHLSPAGLQKLLDGIADVATGRRDGPSLAVLISQRLEQCCLAGGPPIELSVAKGVTFIAHDRAGSAPIAWLAMASLHAQQSPPWEVSDEILSAGEIGTRSWKEGRLGRGESIGASSLLSLAKKEDKDCDGDLQFIRAEERPNGIPIVAPAQQNRSDNPPQTLSSATYLEPNWNNFLRRILTVYSRRRIYIALVLVALIGASFLLRRDRQMLEVDDNAGQELVPLEGLRQDQRRAESRLAALEKEFAELKGWRERIERRELIQRVLSREDGAIEEAKRLWEKEPEWLRIVLQETRKYKENKFAMLNLLIALQETDRAILMRSQKDLAEFLDEMENNSPGPRTALVMRALRERMNRIE
jgi:hypothetical protein